MIIAGVNKAGTSSLYVALGAHPDVCASTVKETRFFLPPRWGQALPPLSVYESYFEGDQAVRLEASPSYCYGGADVATAIADNLADAQILLVLREPVDRALSFFAYQKTRLRVPRELSLAEYLAIADRMTDDDFRDPANERYFAARGSCYADFLPAWAECFAPSALHVIFFEDLVARTADVLASTVAWMGVDPARLPSRALADENRTTGFRRGGLQRIALGVNDRFERVLRRHPGVERRMRDLYYRVNGASTAEAVDDLTRCQLAERFQEPNARLAQQLRAMGLALPNWLDETAHADGPAER